jgi:peptidoglycan/xylan/chitin deacetylase (PgdA/CDA1 family)
MHYVILRDDDTSAFTPPACLERIYRPFLDRGMPVNLAVIPEVRTDVRTPDGWLEGYLTSGRGPSTPLAPIGLAREIVEYIRGEPGYHVVQHGCHHDIFEFGGTDRVELARRLDLGAQFLGEAGLGRPRAFVAPYDRMSRAAFVEVAARFDVISTGWFEARRLPRRWWAAFALKKLLGHQHWRAGGEYLLSHPGCLLSFRRPREQMLASVRKAVEGASLTVLVMHWWEFFRGGVPDEKLIGIAHEVADWLASRQDVRVVSFDDVAKGGVPLR